VTLFFPAVVIFCDVTVDVCMSCTNYRMLKMATVLSYKNLLHFSQS